MDHTEVGAGSALLELSEAAKESGKYDVWEEEEEVIPEDGVTDKKPKVKVRILLYYFQCDLLLTVDYQRHLRSLIPDRRYISQQ